MKHFKRLGSSHKACSGSGKAKRPRVDGGHKNTKIAICLECFEAKKTKFWLSRYNQSTVKDHIRTTHKGSISADRIVHEDAIGGKDAMNEYEHQTKSRYYKMRMYQHINKIIILQYISLQNLSNILLKNAYELYQISRYMRSITPRITRKMLSIIWELNKKLN